MTWRDPERSLYCALIVLFLFTAEQVQSHKCRNNISFGGPSCFSYEFFCDTKPNTLRWNDILNESENFKCIEFHWKVVCGILHSCIILSQKNSGIVTSTNSALGNFWSVWRLKKMSQQSQSFAFVKRSYKAFS